MIYMCVCTPQVWTCWSNNSFLPLTTACRTHTATGQGSHRGRWFHQCSLHSSDLPCFHRTSNILYKKANNHSFGRIFCTFSIRNLFHRNLVSSAFSLTGIEASDSLGDNPLEVVDHRVGHRVGGDVPEKGVGSWLRDMISEDFAYAYAFDVPE